MSLLLALISSGTHASVTASDTLNPLSDSAVRIVALPRTSSDSLSALTDSAFRNPQSFLRTSSDSLNSISDSASRLIKLQRTASDALAALSETTAVFKGISRTASDTLSAITDSAVRVAHSRVRTVADSLSTISDTALRQSQSFLRTATDSLGISYKNYILSQSPAAYWPMNDSVGTVAVDATGNGYNLTVANVAGATLGGPNVLPSESSTSLTCDGTVNGAASQANVLAALNDVNGQSIEWWMHFNGLPASLDYIFGTTGTSTGHLDRWNGDGTAYPTHFETIRHNSFGSFVIPTTGVHHVLYTRKTGGRFRLIFDGILVADDPAGIFGVLATLWLAGNGNNLQYKGDMAHVAIYNRELSVSDGLAHYNAGNVGLGLSDVATMIKGIIRTASDTLNAISDNAVRATQSRLRTASDSLSVISDSVTRQPQSFLRTAIDTLATITESTTRKATAFRTASDALNALSDTTVRQSTSRNRTASDVLVTISDSTLRRPQSFLRTALDVIQSIIDAAFIFAGIPVFVDAITWSRDGVGEVYSRDGGIVSSRDGVGDFTSRDGIGITSSRDGIGTTKTMRTH